MQDQRFQIKCYISIPVCICLVHFQHLKYSHILLSSLSYIASVKVPSQFAKLRFLQGLVSSEFIKLWSLLTAGIQQALVSFFLRWIIIPNYS